MSFIDPHIHMVSRTTDDYEKMAIAGCVAVGEPAFWAGFDRTSPYSFLDYFHQLTEFEPKRAAKYAILHTAWICMNPKESENLNLSREVIGLIPKFLSFPNVIGVGEIGLNKITPNEIKIFEEQINLAIKYNQLIMIHTPHLEDKLRGTNIILDILKNRSDIDSDRVLIDHVEEITVQNVIDQGFWAGMTLYPYSKISIPRAIDVIQKFQGEKLMANSGGDWGPSDPLAVPKLQLEMKIRSYSPELIQKVTYHNPEKFMSKSGKFSISSNVAPCLLPNLSNEAI